MNKLFPAILATAAFAVPFSTFASQGIDGHRVGLGFSKTKDVTLDESISLGGGIKLEYGYEINHIFGINASYQGFGDSWGPLNLDGSTLKFDTDIGYTFMLEQATIKPYGAIGLARIGQEYSLDGVDGSAKTTDNSLLLGFGVRATVSQHFYADMRFDFMMTEYEDIDQFSISFGYKF